MAVKNERTHTPGPWEAQEHNGRFDIVADLRGADRERTAADFIATCESDTDVSRADAHLISAAPDMFAALDEIANADLDMSEPLFGRVVAALAKARGQVVR